MRLSQENENRQGSPDHQPPPPHRTQKAVGLSHSFPRSQRVRSKDDFRRIRRQGKRVMGKLVTFDVVSEKIPYQRLGITVSKKFGPAHLRNLFKRRTREAFRQSQLPPGTVVHVSPRQEKLVPTLAQLLDDFAHLIC
jgi:ribonuclease P protein component